MRKLQSYFQDEDLFFQKFVESLWKTLSKCQILAHGYSSIMKKILTLKDKSVKKFMKLKQLLY